METILAALRVLYVVGSAVARLILRAIAVIGSTIFWLLSLAVLALVAAIAVAATVSLGPRFGTAAIVVILLIIVLPIALRMIALLMRGVLRPTRRPAKWDKQIKLRIASAFFVVMLTMLGFLAAMEIIESVTRPQDAEAARESFSVKYAPGVDPARLERTLAEFERIRLDLAEQWTVPDSSPLIRLHLLRDAYDYREHTLSTTGIEWSSGHAFCSENDVTIVVPLEEIPSMMDAQPISTTPAHEMVHAIWCQKLDADLFWSIPRWFHEGMAERYGNERALERWKKALNRWMVWIYQDDLLPVAQFCNYQPTGNLTEIGLFYDASWEFIRSLEARHGIQALNSIVEDVGGGKAFDHSLRDRLGGTCDELYREWTQSFQFIPSIMGAVFSPSRK